MKLVKYMFLSLSLLSSTVVLGNASSYSSSKMDVAELEQQLELYRQEQSETIKVIASNQQARTLFNALDAARQGEFSTLNALETIKDSQRSYGRIAWEFALKNKEVAAIISLSALAGALIHKLFFSKNCCEEQDPFFIDQE